MLDGATAGLILVAASTDAGLSLFAVEGDAAGLGRAALPALDQTRQLARLEFAGVTGRLIGSSRYYGHESARSEIEIGWTFIVRSHWGGATNREVKRLMLDHAFSFVDTVIFWVGEQNWRSQGAMTKIGGVKRSGLFTRELSGDTPYFIFEIGKRRYEQGGRALVS